MAHGVELFKHLGLVTLDSNKPVFTKISK
jgi:hypothetical protein